jgi:arsenite-transporting ATPase
LDLKPGNMVGIPALESLFVTTSGAGITDDAAQVPEVEDLRWLPW